MITSRWGIKNCNVGRCCWGISDNDQVSETESLIWASYSGGDRVERVADERIVLVEDVSKDSAFSV